MRAIVLIICWLLTVSCPALAAGTYSDQDISTNIQTAYEAMSGFSASFEQEMFNQASGAVEQRAGTVLFKKPALIRWENKQPEPELLLVGENEVWNYFADEFIAYKYPVNRVLSSQSMITFLSGQSRLDEDFVIFQEPTDKPGPGSAEASDLLSLVLIPKQPEPSLVQAYVWVDTTDWFMRRAVLQDFYGNENRVYFTDIKKNPDYPDNAFTFTPPEGVDVEDNTSPSPEERTLTQ